MKRPAVLILKPIFIFFVNCKENNKENVKGLQRYNKSYFDDKNTLDPLAQHKMVKQYNDQLQFEMTASFRKKNNWLFFNKYQTIR
jgi:DNA/RNA-binding domain of Phe-tRNA-synthetase-like protein